VDGESRALDELLAAARVIADVRPNTAVDALVPSKITTPGKALAASRACKGLWQRGAGRPTTIMHSLLLMLLLLRLLQRYQPCLES